MKKAALLLFVVCLCCPFSNANAEELPATFFCNPAGGRFYHANANCPSVNADYLPMTPFDRELLNTPEYSALKPCQRCIFTSEISAYPQQAEGGETSVAAVASAINGEEAARQFAEAFFTSPYVEVPLNGRLLTVSQTAEGWRAALSSADKTLPTLTVWFAADGRVQQYQNSAYALPTLDGFTIRESISLEDGRRIDAVRDALFPNLENNVGGVFARDGDTVFYTIDHFSAWLGLAMGAETPKLVAYGDFGTDAARYPEYRTRGEAAEAAKQALAEAYGLSAAQVENLMLMQADFILQEGLWTDANVPLPYWFLVFGDETDDLTSQYSSLIDAETGNVLELHDPATSGNS